MDAELKAGLTLLLCGCFGVAAAMYILQDPFLEA